MYQKGGGGQETRQKSGNLPPKAGELASLPLYHATCQKIFESQLLMMFVRLLAIRFDPPTNGMYSSENCKYFP